MICDKEFDELMKEHGGLVVKIAKKFTKKNGIFEFGDLLQEAKVEMINAHKGFNPKFNISKSSYIAMSIKRKLTKIHKREIKKKERECGLVQYLRHYNKNEQHKKVMDVIEFYGEIENIAGIDRKIIDMRIDGKTFQEISDHFKCSKQAIEQRLRKIKKKITQKDN